MNGSTGGIETTRLLTLKQYLLLYNVITQQATTITQEATDGSFPSLNIPAACSAGGGSNPFENNLLDASILLTRFVMCNICDIPVSLVIIICDISVRLVMNAFAAEFF